MLGHPWRWLHMVQPYPLPRTTRETAILNGNGGATYGPFQFKIFDTLDVKAFIKPQGAEFFSPATITVAKTSTDVFADFTVTFSAAIPATTQLLVKAERLHERQIAITKAGALSAVELEKELSKQGSVLNELRRDVNRGGSVVPGAQHQALMFDAEGRVVPGPDLVAEAAGWRQADIQLQQNINAEAQARVAANQQLQQNINAERQQRQASITAETAARIAGDKAVASLFGQAGPIEVPLFDSRLAASLANINVLRQSFRTAGFTEAGDGGGAVYRRVVSEPEHAGKLQSADGAWWELATQPLNVRMFGAVGDNVADDTAALIAAVDFAFARSVGLNWPTGDYFTTGSLPHYHDVRHEGPGRIFRGDKIWHITPTGQQVNILFCSPSGTGDGLSEDAPMTFATAVEGVFSNLGVKAVQGYWKIKMLGGAYGASSAVDVRRWPYFGNAVEIYGEKNLSGEHLTVINRGGTTGRAIWFRMAPASSERLQYGSPRIQFVDLNVVGWVQGVSIFMRGGRISEFGCKFENCTYGIWTQSADIEAYGEYHNCEFGVRAQYHAEANVGRDGLVAKFYNCTLGVDFGRLSAGGVRAAEFYNCGTCMRAQQNSRFEYGTIYAEGWTACVLRIESGVTLNREGTITHDGVSVTPSKPLIWMTGHSLADQDGNGPVRFQHRHLIPENAIILANTTDRTIFETLAGGTGTGIPFRLDGNRYWSRYITLEMELMGELIRTAGTKTLQLTGPGAGTGLIMANRIAPADWEGAFKWSVAINVCPSGKILAEDELTLADGRKLFQRLYRTGGVQGIFPNSSAIASCRIYLQLADATDALAVQRMTTFITG
jgi:hypothetical protein